MQRRNTDTELARIRAAVTDPHILDAVQHYGLAEYLGGGPLAVDKFSTARRPSRWVTPWPGGRGLATLRADPPHPQVGPRRAAVATIYLADRPEEPRTQEALKKGLGWATEEINETVALLGRRFPDPTDATVEAFEAFDYLVDHITEAALAIPEQLWQLSLDEAQPTEWMDLGYAAYQSTNLPVAEHAFHKAADDGDSEAMFFLGVLLAGRGDSGAAETWYRRAAQAGDSDAMVNLGVLLAGRGDSGAAETWYRRAAQAGDSDAMVNLGVLLERRGELDEVETWWRRAADTGNSPGMANLGVLLTSGGNSARRKPGAAGRPTPATAGGWPPSGCS